jgi:transcriptional regulator with GAF, ATPase, and Fis domain
VEVSVGDYATIPSSGADQAERTFERIIGNSAALESVLSQVEQVAPTDSTVLIEGETGTAHRACHSHCKSALWTRIHKAELRGDSAGSSGKRVVRPPNK